MWKHLTPTAFYGAALAACIGLALGLAFHSQWENHAGGPQILAGSSAAATDSDLVLASASDDATAAYADNAILDTSQLPPDSLPVVRLNHRGGTALPAAIVVERVSFDETQTTDLATADDIKSDADTQPNPRPTPHSYVTTASIAGQTSGF